jgi:hypothetical protein
VCAAIVSFHINKLGAVNILKNNVAKKKVTCMHRALGETFLVQALMNDT